MKMLGIVLLLLTAVNSSAAALDLPCKDTTKPFPPDIGEVERLFCSIKREIVICDSMANLQVALGELPSCQIDDQKRLYQQAEEMLRDHPKALAALEDAYAEYLGLGAVYDPGRSYS